MKAILKRLSVVAVMAAIAICFGVPATTHAATTLPKTGWNEVSKGVWMYDGSDADLVADTNTSVLEANGRTYYVGDNGIMVTNKWVNTGSDQVPVMHYYLADGSRVENGWVLIASVRYHFTAGTLDANNFFTDVDGKEYLLAKDGKVVTGWVNNGTVLVPVMNYYSANGAQVIDGWALIAGAWYHFDATGLMEKDTQFTDSVDGKDYILGKDGKMITGWTKDGNSKWVFAGPSGSLQSGWVKSSGVWYFLDATNGYEMAASSIIAGATPADPQYYVNADGSWKTNKGWISNTQYVGDKGVLKCSDWALVDGLWYYFDANGTMVTNDVVTHEKTINGVSWFFNADGSLVTKAGLYDVYRAVGGKVANGWVLVSASDKLGTTSNWLYCKDGIAETNKWVSYNGSWYFLDVDGNMVAGKEAVDPTTSLDYYFNAAGVMQVGTFKIGGVDKTFGPSGAFIR